uniref:Immunoglobulin domain-containing protein n=1 Tax=Poecilia reticulata TaxID=8081 RepID=A0A3P9Q695_POERE
DRDFLVLSFCCYFSWVAVSVCLFQTVTVQTHEEVTLRCVNLSWIAGHIFWFKLADGANVSRISSMSTSEAVPSFFDEFHQGRFTMRSNVTNIFLDIKQVEVNDSGLYFCGFYAEDFPGVFSATYLHVEGKIIEEPDNLMNWILGGVVIFLAMVIISLLVTVSYFILQNLDSCTQNYSALRFPPKVKSNRRPAAERVVESRGVLYAATR